MDRVTANVFADWLDDHDEPVAAAKLRAAFPLLADDGRGMARIDVAAIPPLSDRDFLVRVLGMSPSEADEMLGG